MFMMYPIVVREGDKTPLVNFLEDHAIETRDLLPLLNQPVYRKLFGDLEPRYPVARWINRSGFYVGCHQYLGRKDLDTIIGAVHAFYKKG